MQGAIEAVGGEKTHSSWQTHFFSQVLLQSEAFWPCLEPAESRLPEVLPLGCSCPVYGINLGGEAA